MSNQKHKRAALGTAAIDGFGVGDFLGGKEGNNRHLWLCEMTCQWKVPPEI